LEEANMPLLELHPHETWWAWTEEQISSMQKENMYYSIIVTDWQPGNGCQDSS
jgi:hypothetical protein